MESFAQSYDASMFRDTFEHEFTYLNGFLRNVHRYADKPALTDPLRDKTWSYTELNKEVNKLAHALQADDAGKNDVVMYQLLNSPEFAFLYLAPQKLGAVNCPINFRLAPAETAEINDESKPEIYFYDAYVQEMVEKALQLADHKPARIVMLAADENEISPLPEAITYSDYVSGVTELITCIHVIQNGIIPATINLNNEDPECDLDYVPQKVREATVDTAMSNSFGFGGQNASLIVRRFGG